MLRILLAREVVATHSWNISALAFMAFAKNAVRLTTRDSRALRHSCGSRNPEPRPRIESGVTLSLPRIGQKFLLIGVLWLRVKRTLDE